MKKYIIYSIPLFLMFTALAVLPAAAQELSVDQIVTRANNASYYGGDDGKAKVHMTITDSQGRVRNREFIILRKDESDGGPQEFYVYFKKPSDVRKMVFMVHKFINKDDDRWLYLPALDLVKRIAASDKRTSFVGSHFFYEDVSGRNISEDTHTLVKTTDTQYVLENKPKHPDTVEFSHYTLWIDKKTFLPVKAEYYDRENTLYRVVEALKIKDIQGIPTVIKSRIRDLASKGQTVAEFSEIQYNIGLKDSIFTERYLRKPPREARR